MKPVEAWQQFHRQVVDGEPAEIARRVAPLIGSDFGATIPERQWLKALSSKPHMQTALYQAMVRRYGDDPTGGVRYC